MSLKFLYLTEKQYLCTPKIKTTVKNNEEIVMTKAEIVNVIAEQTGIGKRDIATTVEAFMEQIRISLADNKQNVYLRGFGSFIVKHRAPKTARNISKNTTMLIDAHDLPAFKPCKSFIARMDGITIEDDEEMEEA